MPQFIMKEDDELEMRAAFGGSLSMGRRHREGRGADAPLQGINRTKNEKMWGILCIRDIKINYSTIFNMFN